MNTGLNLTFDFLATTRNTASIDILVDSFDRGEDEIRRLVVSSLVGRDAADSFRRLIEIWDRLNEEEQQLIGEASPQLGEYVARQIAGRHDAVWFTAAEMAEKLSLFRVLPELTARAENAANRQQQQQALATVLQMSGALGTQARTNANRSRFRLSAIDRLNKSIETVEFHRQYDLIDGFLSAATWSDAALRSALARGSETVELITSRLQCSQNPCVIDLLAGWISKQRIPESVVSILQERFDGPFHDSLLRYITGKPTRLTLRNLSDLGSINAISRIEEPLTELDAEYHAAYIRALAKLTDDDLRVRSIAIEMIDGGSEQALVAACYVLKQLGPLDPALAREDVRSLGLMLRKHAPQDQLQGSLLWRQIELMNYPNEEVQSTIRVCLENLQAAKFFMDFEPFNVQSIRPFVPVIRLVDSHLDQFIEDELKHPVMERRLRALDLAAAFDRIDDRFEALAELFDRDHLEIKIKIVESLRYATIGDAAGWLDQLSQSPSGPIRDAACTSLKNQKGSSCS